MFYQQPMKQIRLNVNPLALAQYPPYHGLTTMPFFCQGQNINIFIPCYMKMILNNIKKLQMQRLTAIVEGHLELTLNLLDLPEFIKNFIVNNVQFEFTNGTEITLSKSSLCLVTFKNHLIKFTYGNQIPMILDNTDIFLAPFDICTLTSSIVLSCNTLNYRGTKYNIRFNLMDSSLMNDKFKLDLTQTPSEFKISELHLGANFTGTQFDRMMFTETSLTTQQQLDRSKSFHYAMYSISQYRYPGTAIVTLFIPIWIFAFANLAIFFQTPQLHDRISSIATLMIAYTAFIPYLRQRLPLTRRITFLDISLYLLISTSFVCLNQSISIRNIPLDNYQFDYKKNPAFIYSVVILILSMLSVLILMLIHKFIWQPKYNKQTSDQQEKSDSQFQQLNIDRWSNIQCDRYFSQYRQYMIPIKYLRI